MTEWNYYELCITMRNINLYGFTMNPDTSNYMVIMDYADKGNLRENLTKIIKKNWKDKLFMLNKIINGLNVIHMQNIIHYGFHDGNILVKKGSQLVVSDLGLCQTVNFLKKNDIFGVIPFIAPEVLRGKPYTQASDIYSFSMIMWEFTSGIPPFNDRAHDFQLALSICKGERPKIIENTPQCYVDLMKKCWNEDPLKRPSTPEVTDIIRSWIFYPEDENLTEELINIAMKFIDAPIECNNFTTESHPQAYYKSRLQDFTSEKLNEILENKHSDYIITDKSSEKLNEVVESKF
ncbi:hypothetical protein RclHR1_14430003 [Rhizophagus clarus]|uniref:Protein kinase domain-containing protein n=1 Tax=Rhizophagus clarus TaxID=94130 RepID=A0A2Z6R5B4_9GLOM|nr:hypothetical protein RclHR1_14430003 [Rhizophagus clarus]